MKVKYLFIILMILLSGCTQKNEVEELQLELALANEDHESELNDLIAEYEIKLNEKEEVEINFDAEDLKQDKIDEYEQEIEILKQEYRILQEALFGLPERTDSIEGEIKITDGSIRVYTEGTDVLEDGIVIILEIFDGSNQLIWNHVWEEIPVGDLSTHSLPITYEDRLYIVIDGNLNAFNLKTGDTLWEPIYVGSIGYSPKVDSGGIIYATGQYGPYLTAITSNGEIKWQYATNEMVETSNIALTENYILILDTSGITIFDKEGNRLE